jgi:hypothetical protein
MATTQLRPTFEPVAISEGLTWKDAGATLGMALVALITPAVVEGWGWPVLGSARMGTLAIGVIGLAMCIGFSARDIQAMVERKRPRNAYVSVASFLGSLAFVLMIVGLITGSELFLVALAADIAVLYLASTFRHALRV